MIDNDFLASITSDGKPLDSSAVRLIIAEAKRTLSDFVPKSSFDEVSSKVQALTAQAAAAGDSVSRADHDAAIEKVHAHYREHTVSQAIASAIGDSAHDAELVAKLIDRDKVKVQDGKVSGLEEQLATIRTDKAFLFKQTSTSAAADSQPERLFPPPPAKSMGALVPGKVPEGATPLTIAKGIAARKKALMNESIKAQESFFV